ncbi:hypothetical protein KSP39_PZI014309 [Platanthera zijinensis]|uniref:Uncharacterized protein n=1 Tax=Platanthera zijinensis TaxID=2320716 RepID=A0AAP0BAL7_9ASPA
MGDERRDLLMGSRTAGGRRDRWKTRSVLAGSKTVLAIGPDLDQNGGMDLLWNKCEISLGAHEIMRAPPNINFLSTIGSNLKIHKHYCCSSKEKLKDQTFLIRKTNDSEMKILIQTTGLEKPAGYSPCMDLTIQIYRRNPELLLGNDSG